MNKNELIAQVESRRDQIEAILARQTPEQLDRKIQGDWSFKDTLAHIAFWDGELVDLLELAVRGVSVTPQVEDDDTINARVYHANRGRPLTDVAADFRQVYQRLLDHLAQLSDEQLNMPSPTAKNWILASHVIDNMQHVDEHLAPIAALNA